MNSILTNTSAMTALQNLAMTQKSLSTVQSQISSGLKVSTASDNAAYWSISTTMKSDTGALGAVSDALNLGSSVVGTANSAISSTLTILNKIKADIVTASTPGTDPTQVQTDISAQQASLTSIVGSASFNGVNLLNNTQGTASFVSGFTRTTGGTSINTIQLNTNSTALTGTNGVLQAGGALTGSTNITTFALSATTTTTQLATYASDIDAAIKAVTAIGARVGQTQTNINTQSDYVSALTDAITSGVGSLEDTDMNVASTKLQALQTQQQLGVQALSIANQNTQLIQKQFQG